MIPLRSNRIAVFEGAAVLLRGLYFVIVRAVKCPNPDCAKENADEHKFCAQCGLPLRPDLRATIYAVISERLKDREMVEVTTAQAISKRVWEWAELLGKWIGIGVALLIAGLCFFGYRNVKDVETTGHAVKNSISNLTVQVSNQVSDIQAHLTRAKSSLMLAENLAGRLTEIDVRLSNALTSLDEVVALSNRLSGIEESFEGYRIPDELSAHFDEYLKPFKAYLTNVGFQIPTQKLEFRFTVKKGSETEDESYPGSPYKVVFGAKLYQANEYRDTPDGTRLHFAYFVLDQGVLDTEPSTVKTALALYFAASFLDNSSPFPVTARILENAEDHLTNSHSFAFNSSEKYTSWTNDTALAALLWEMRSNAGRSTTDRLAKDAWEAWRTDFPSGQRDRGIQPFLRFFLPKLQTVAPNAASELKGSAQRRGVEL